MKPVGLYASDVEQQEEAAEAQKEEAQRDGEEPAKEDEELEEPEQEQEEEGETIRMVKDPGTPTAAERAAHEVTHIPYRAWCNACARGRAIGQ